MNFLRIVFLLQAVLPGLAFLVDKLSSRASSCRLAALSTPQATSVPAVTELAQQIETCIRQDKDPEEWLQKLEALNTFKEPNRSPSFLGEWHVWYTNCPPPSNGQLGPFQGTAGQVIQDESTRSYQNLLKVPPNDWLTATLDGIWEEWDGQLLSESGSAEGTAAKQDWGANHWKVTFQRLRIALLGFTLLNKEFPPGTCRIWRTTYLDDNIRIVRAGKTGRVQDEVVFYTKRTPAPS